MRLPISKLVNNTGQIEGLPANPRTINKDDYQKLLKSLQEDPDFLNHKPLHVYEHNGKYVVLGGNQRLKALKELGYKDVPVTIYDPETPVEVLKRRVIIDNSTFGDYDMDMLANEWDSEPLDDWGVDLPDDWLEQEPEVVEDEAPEVSDEPPVSKLGEVYQLGRHRVMCGDSTDNLNIAKLLDGNSMDFILTDPPYGIGISSNPVRQKHEKSDWDAKPITSEAIRNLLEYSKKAIIWGGNYFDLPPSKGFVVWDKKQPENFSLAMCEMAWSSVDKPAKIYRESVTSYQKNHPTQKPVGLMAWCMDLYDAESNVIDFYLGSGSTLIACEQTGRTCYGMELDPKYVDVIRKRYHKFVTGSEEGWEDGTKAI